MRKIAIGLVVGVATLAGPARSEIVRRKPVDGAAEKVETSRTRGGAPGLGREDKSSPAAVKLKPGDVRTSGDQHLDQRGEALKPTGAPSKGEERSSFRKGAPK